MAPTLNSLVSSFSAWLGREDSNPRSRDQNPLPYHLATPQRAARHGRSDHISVVRRARWRRAYIPGRVMAPSLADDTSAAYFASTPDV